MDDGRTALTLNALVEQHYELLYRYAYRLTGSASDAEDLTQQAFLMAQIKLPQLREMARAKAWLCTIVRNIYLKELRDQNGVGPVSLDRVPEPETASGVKTVVDREELQTILNELPEEYRSPLILFYFHEMSYREIAEQLDVPMGTVMSRLARSKKYLRERMSTAEGEASARNHRSDPQTAAPMQPLGRSQPNPSRGPS